MWNRITWFFKVPAVALAALLLLAGAYFGSTKDFGAFVFSMPILPFLLFCTIVATIWAMCIKTERSRSLAALALICLTPLAYLGSYGTVQKLRFLVWAPLHFQQLAQATQKDGVIKGWDSWGFGGEDTSSYLVTDTKDRLENKERGQEWTKEIGQSCGIAEAQRMWPKLYVVTTYTDCSYAGVEPAG